MPAVVQSVVGTITAGTTGTATLASAPTAGNALLVIYGTAAVSSIVNTPTDNNSRTYVFVGGGTNGAGLGNAIYLVTNVSAASTVVTGRFTATGTGVFVVMEVSGITTLTTASALDPNSSAGVTGSATAVTTGNLTTTQTNDYLIMCAVNKSILTYTAAAGWGSLINASNGTAINLGIDTKSTTTAAAYAGAITQSGTGSWLSAMVSLKTSPIVLPGSTFTGISSLTGVTSITC